MMNRVELNEEMMEQVNGGEYKIYTVDTNELIARYTMESGAVKAIERLNAIGIDVRVCTTNIFDNDDVAGVYLANR